MDYFEKDVIKELIKSKIELAKTKFGKEFSDCLIELLSLEKMINNEQNYNNNSKNISECNHQRQIPLSQWDKYYPDPSVPAMRMLDFKRAENGFDEFNVTERRGKRVLVNEDNYFAWKEAYKQ